MFNHIVIGNENRSLHMNRKLNHSLLNEYFQMNYILQKLFANQAFQIKWSPIFWENKTGHVVGNNAFRRA